MKITQYLIGSAVFAAALLTALACPDVRAHGHSEHNTQPAELSDGEIRKVDKSAKKLTIKHGEIKNLDMPGMTMLFQVKDVAMLDRVKPGDVVKFRVERQGGALVVTELVVTP
jgi:Cu(I)/Ag(I) efflux system protein CusF